MAIPCTNELELPSSSGSIYSKSMVGRETRSSLGCLSEGSGAASQSVADQKRRGSRTKFVNCGTASSSEGRYWLPTYKASRFQGYKVGIRSARHIHTSPYLTCADGVFHSVPAGTLLRFRQLKSSFESAFEFLRVERPLKCRCRTFDSTPHGSETSRISSAYFRLCRSKAYLPTGAPKTTSPGQCSCRNTGARRGRSESHSPQPPLVGCVPSGTLPRFLHLKSSLESAFEFIRVEKTAYLLLQEHLVPLRRDSRRPESHQPFFSCAGVKAYAPTDVPKTTPPGQCSCRNTGARLGRSYKSHAPQHRSEVMFLQGHFEEPRSR
jgi:hypothetical protein